MSIEIRPAKSHSDYQRCVDLERKIWGYSDPHDLVPASMLIAVHKNGGVLLCAFQGEEMVGFVFGFAGLRYGRLIHWSHMLGVISEHRSRGTGRALKLAQRQAVLDQGIDTVAWTYDPLQAKNAYFNFVKLGVFVEEYEVNIYGESSSLLHRGLATDRFVAQWPLRSRNVLEKISGRFEQAIPLAACRPINQYMQTRSGLPASSEPQLKLDADSLALYIPLDIQLIKENDIALAADWQGKLRRACLAYFERGYRIIDFVMERDRCFYLFARRHDR